jgi:hypothetical protein
MRLPHRARRSLEAELALDIDALFTAARDDQSYVVLFWNLYRDKTRILELLVHSYKTRSLPELATLSIEAVRAVDEFYDVVDHFVVWLHQTEAMPASLDRRYTRFVERLGLAHAQAIEALGGHPPAAERPTFPDSWRTLTR